MVGHCGACIAALITRGSCHNPRFTRVRPVIGMGTKSHTINGMPSGRRGPAYLYGSFSSVSSRCPLVEGCGSCWIIAYASSAKFPVCASLPNYTVVIFYVIPFWLVK
ncbi:hypothetical protein AVEN_122258-1 [Araneus ventricosus]|uniref:Uncharacterized protein n=1 Tax=Araneus ventricosus TaxID=182803 RepID=A0A4Y2PLU1_ARAVE|nr:hypothetical protein AVEN_122258-1 [Araneus ventricosus]